MLFYFDQTVTEGKSDASTTIQDPEINATIAMEVKVPTGEEIASKKLPTSSKTEHKNVPERNATEKNKENTTPVSSSGNKSGNNRRSFSTVATSKKRPTPFHAQKELYRSSKITPNSDTDDSNSSSSDDD